MNHSNEAGIPGPDSEYGVGMLDVGRIMSRGIPGSWMPPSPTSGY